MLAIWLWRRDNCSESRLPFDGCTLHSTHSKLLSMCQFVVFFSRLPFHVGFEFGFAVHQFHPTVVIKTQLITFFRWMFCIATYIWPYLHRCQAITSDNFLVNSTASVVGFPIFAVCMQLNLILSLMMFAWHFLLVIQSCFGLDCSKRASDETPTFVEKDAVPIRMHSKRFADFSFRKYFNLFRYATIEGARKQGVLRMFSREWHFYMIKYWKFVTCT